MWTLFLYKFWNHNIIDNKNIEILKAMTSQSVKLLNYKKLILNGIFAVFKEKGEAIQDYQTWIRLTLKHGLNYCSIHKYLINWKLFTESGVEFGVHGVKEIVKIVPKYMEPFASGVVCVGLGHRNIGLIHLARFWKHVCNQSIYYITFY
jgi:hypothetical protein